MRVEFHPLVADDLNDAVAYYNARRESLGNALRAEVYGVIDRIVENPGQYRVVRGDIRRCLVRRFPYSVLYRVVGEDLVRILAIRHHRRQPGFGLGRT
jgi:plasmid stabilization system protein ParE